MCMLTGSKPCIMFNEKMLSNIQCVIGIKVDMKRKLRQTFHPYCDVCPSESASRARKNEGMGFDFASQELIGWLWFAVAVISLSVTGCPAILVNQPLSLSESLGLNGNGKENLHSIFKAPQLAIDFCLTVMSQKGFRLSKQCFYKEKTLTKKERRKTSRRTFCP